MESIGKFFISLLLEFRIKKKDAPVDTEHPSSLVLVRQMRFLHTRRYDALHFAYRAKQVCNGT